MGDTDKDRLIAAALTTSYGRQKIAWMMAGSKEPFVYRPVFPGESSQAYANSLRARGELERTPGMREFFERAAATWDEQARVERAAGLPAPLTEAQALAEYERALANR